MTTILFRKLFRDVWISLLVVALLLLAFETLWARVTYRVSKEIPEMLTKTMNKRLQPLMGRLASAPTSLIFLERVRQDVGDTEKIMDELTNDFFEGPGQIIQALIGGDQVKLTQAVHMMSVGYVHPLIQTILCIWAVGRASGAIAGEIDRGTMELLLAQPIPRWKLIGAHLCIDLITIPILCLSMWAGIWLGAWLMGMIDNPDSNMQVDPIVFGPALLSTAMFIFAISGYTMWLSSLGRNRGRVMGIAVLVTLLQFLVNIIGQIWEVMEPLRPYTVFYYYNPQKMIWQPDWISDMLIWQQMGVLLATGAIGYLLALWTFQKRDLPAPL